nr:immunoglobulin-like domain-containing protein [Neobacillus terrae]
MRYFFLSIGLLLLYGSLPHNAEAASDRVKPKINGAVNKTIYLGMVFNALSGVTGDDNKDGNLTKKIVVTGSVNNKKAGTYKLIYTVSDKSRNKTTVIRVITVKKDTVKPVILGTSNKTILLGTSFNALTGVSAHDNIDGFITKNLKVTGSVNPKAAGKYTLTYSVSDSSGNAAVSTRVITVLDNVKPVLAGIKDTAIHMGDVFNPLNGITATDNNDGNLTSKIVVKGSVNMNKADVYHLTYSVTDRFGNTASANRNVTVLDNVAPVLSGVQDIQVTEGNPFYPVDGISAWDNNDGDVTSKIEVTSSVNVNLAGSYSLTYYVSDQAGNTSSAFRTVTVVDQTPPVISGADSKTIGLYNSFDPLSGISATDNNDGDLTSKITVDGSADPNSEGTYRVTYSVTDTAGNFTSVERVITVQRIHVSSVTISAPSTIKTGQNVPLKTVINPVDATDQNTTWQSSDESVAIINANGVLTTFTEGTVTITATVDGVSATKTIMVSNRPNLYLYRSGAIIFNNLYKSFSLTLSSLEPEETVSIMKVDIYQNNSLYSSYTAQELQSAGISTTLGVYPSSWGMTINFALGIWQNQSKAVVTVSDPGGAKYQYSVNL